MNKKTVVLLIAFFAVVFTTCVPAMAAAEVSDVGESDKGFALENFNIIILILLVVTAIISLQVRDLLSASMVFGIYSFLICLLWAEMGAVDVAFTEAAVGAGVGAVFMIATVFRTCRKSSD